MFHLEIESDKYITLFLDSIMPLAYHLYIKYTYILIYYISLIRHICPGLSPPHIYRLHIFQCFNFVFNFLFPVINPTAPEESSSSDDPLFAEPIAPTLSLGERVAWVQNSGPEFGLVKWIGRMPQITNDWTVGIEFVCDMGY